MKKIIILVVFVFPLLVKAQSGMMLPVMVVGSDSFPTCTLQDVVIVSKISFKDPLDEARFNMLKRNVMIVYPYAKEAGQIFGEINASLSDINRKKEQNQYLKSKEKQLDDLFEQDLKNMTVTQGAILVKLISRETGTNVYDLIKEFKNPASAFFWNKMSSFYGYSLKDNYDPEEDKDIEIIVRSIEGTY